VTTARPVAVSDALIDPFLQGRESVIAGKIRALVCVPLVAADRMIGLIYADSAEPGAAFSELDVEILEALASHAALAIVMARVDRELRGMAAQLPYVAPVAPPPDSSWSGVLAHHRSRTGQES
jgi:GAF domain-containing protein